LVGRGDDISLTVDDSGNALATWTEARGDGRWGVSAASRPAASGRWQPPVQVSPSTEWPNHVASTTDRSGNAVAVWTEGYKDATVHAALRPAASGVWVPQVQIGSGTLAGDVRVAIDEHGNAVAVWERAVGSGYEIDIGELRAGGPVLAQLEVPARAAARVKARFRVTPAAWGSPFAGEPDWDFGDGATAHRASVAHTYRGTGTYTVTVTQADASGRTSRSTATIVVNRATLTNRSRPLITGTPRVGATLTCRPGKWTGSGPIRFRYAWLRGARGLSEPGRATGPGPATRARACHAA
jgi:PKD domain